MRQTRQDPPHDIAFRMTVDGRDKIAPTEMVASSNGKEAFEALCMLLGYCIGQLNIGVGVEHRVEIRLEQLSSVQIVRLRGLIAHVFKVLESDLAGHGVKAAVADYSITFNRIPE